MRGRGDDPHAYVDVLHDADRNCLHREVLAMSFEADWSLPPDQRPTVRVPAPPRPEQSHSLRTILFELGRASRDDLERVRRILDEVLQ